LLEFTPPQFSSISFSPHSCNRSSFFIYIHVYTVFVPYSFFFTIFLPLPPSHFFQYS
jgi:hypothetical protein